MRTIYRETGDPAFIDGLARSALNLLSVGALVSLKKTG
jgi:hypothetical protein